METEKANRCGKCGICLQVCPVYGQTLDEAASPRAKIQLIEHYTEKNLPTSDNLNHIVSRCLMCGGCTTICPSGVELESAFMRMRSCMAADHGEDWQKKVLFHFLSHEEQLRLAAKVAALGQNVVLDKMIRDIKMGNIRIANLPRFNSKPFREQVPAFVEPQGEARGTVLYFVGCSTNYVYEDVGQATVTVLTSMGFRVEVVKEQVCCGLPMYLKGAVETARSNILNNIELFNRPDVVAVVSDCATCGSALNKGYPEVLKELHLDTDAAEELAGRARDISAFLLDHWSILEPLLQPCSTQTKVTYHSPCHLRNAQGIESEVEQLLGQLPNVEYVRAEDFDTCCGGGGTFFYDHPEISKRIADAKIDNAKATGARLWATGCPGCRINLAGNLNLDDDMQLLHPVLLVAAAIKGS